MSDQAFIDKRRAWLDLRKKLDDRQADIDLRSAAHLRREGDPPTRRQLEEIDDLMAEVHQARAEVDMMILDIAT
jgi:hypothetical protein